ncbi:MAG TPA: 6-phospho-3-hexuloisomerase [Spirochaetia bacterium]|nr:6-phospho-3-hexuloisomerase [Spirochaetia bacterium]
MSYEDIRRTAVEEISSVVSRVNAEEMDRLAAAIRAARSVFVAGAGRSGLAIRGFAMRLMHMGIAAHVVGDVTTPALQPGDLLVIASGSGSTPSLVAVAAQAVKRGGTTALLTIDPQSPLAGTAAVVVRVPAPSPKAAAKDSVTSRQPMATLFEQALGVLLDSCIMLLMQLTGVNEQAMFQRHANLE